MKKNIFLCILALLLAACSNTDNNKKNNDNEGRSKVIGDFIGKWQGDIELPQAKLSIIIGLNEITGTLSVPIQGLVDYPFQSVHYTKDTVTVEVNLNGSPIRITGKLEGDKITGTFTQNGQSFPITFTKRVPEEVTYEEISWRVVT